MKLTPLSAVGSGARAGRIGTSDRSYTKSTVMNSKSIVIPSLAIFSYLYTVAAAPAGDSAGAPEEQPVAGSSVSEELSAPTDSVPDDADVTMLEDFTIEVQRKLVQNDGAKLTYNVSEDAEAKSANILDILRKVPGITVDAEGNVKVNGQSSFKILMNNREDPMLKGDLKTILKSIPAASIKKIEVISEPGAKYEAEGAGGILNIVTDSTKDLPGFMTQYSAWISSGQIGGYIDGRTKINKVMLSGSVSYNNGRPFKRSNYSGSEVEDLTGGINHLLKSSTKGRTGWDYTGVNLNMSWEPDTLNLFTLSANYGYNGWDSRADESRTMYSPTNDIIWDMSRNYVTDGYYSGISAEASYQHTFGRQGHNIVVSYLFNNSHDGNNSDIFNTMLQGALTESPFSGNRRKSRSFNHIVQVDYSDQFNKKHLLETGAKFDINHNRNNSYPVYGQNLEQALPDEDQRINVGQFRDIYALYASYTGSFSSWNVKAGVRYEHTRMGLRYHVGEYPDFTTKLNDVVPNMALSYNFSNASALRLAYQMRISRPGLGVLNPYVNVLTPGQVSYGNPDLKSGQTHNLSLSYSNYAGAFSGSAKASWRHSSNSITDVIFMRDDVMNTTYANVGKNDRMEIELSGDWSITNSLRWSVYTSTSYSHIKAESEFLKTTNCGWQTYINTNVNYTMPCKVRLSAYGGYYTPWIDLQSKGSDGYYYGLSASRSFLKDEALTVSVNLSNILPVSVGWHYEQTSETVRLSSHGSQKQWNVGLNISFRFGALTADVKRTAANVQTEAGGGASGKGGGK